MPRTLPWLPLLLLALSAPAWADGAAGGTGSADPEVFGETSGEGSGLNADGSPRDSAAFGLGSDREGGALDLSGLLDEHAPRLKDIGKVGGLRSNQLYGIGLVTGLAGTGDDLGTSKFTGQMVANYLRRQGIQADPNQLKGKNFAAVTITAELPPFSQPGDTLDITVASMGSAKSLEGGQLILSPLRAPNNEVYAMAQGAITLGGFGASASSGGARAEVQKNFLTVGRIPSGAIIERSVMSDLPIGTRLDWVLFTPDFTTAQHAAEALNRAIPGVDAVAMDAQRITLYRPDSFDGGVVEFIAAVEQVQVSTDFPARIVINERNGTIVAGANVRLKPMTVVHGSISVTIAEGFGVSQPNTPFGGGSTALTPEAEVTITEESATGGSYSTVRDLLDAIQAVGGGVRDAVAILQALKAAGAIDAQVMVI